MSKIIITFLGAQGPKPTQYSYGNHIYEGAVFAQALRQWCDYDRMIVCVTPIAREKSWPTLAALDDPRIEALDIENGETTEEMWRTFAAITRQVNEGDSVVFDITHGLRSLPFLVFLFAAYLKEAKRAKITSVFYGALELGFGRPSAPVIELSEFVEMLDWMSASKQFTNTGNGDALATLLRLHTPTGEELKHDANLQQARKQMDGLSKSIENVSQALALTRPIETMGAAKMLEKALTNADTAIQARAQPLAVLKDELASAYTQFGLDNPLEPQNIPKNLQLQLDMIELYLQKKQVVQAITLAREWIVSVVAWSLVPAQSLVSNSVREPIEKAINNALALKRGQQPRDPVAMQADFDAWPPASKIIEVWNVLTGLRNDLAHCGMNDSPRPTANILKSCGELSQKLATVKDIIKAGP